jgi:chromosome segregation ATPase
MPYAIAASVEAMLPEILANECEPLAQTSDLINGEAEQEKLAYFVQALQDAQAQISRLKDERDSLETECLALHAQNGDLNNEIAHLLGELGCTQAAVAYKLHRGMLINCIPYTEPAPSFFFPSSQ